MAPLMRLLRKLAVLLILLGICGLFFATRPYTPPLTDIGEITPGMTYRYVHVTGRVTAPPYIVTDENRITYMSFLLEDPTGHIRVQLSPATAQALAESDDMPWEGAVLNVSGALKLSPEHQIKLRVHRRDQIEALTRKVALRQ